MAKCGEEDEMFEEWPTLTEVVERTGISERTLHRKIAAGELRREYRRIPGRKPLPVLDPEQAKELEQSVLHPISANLPAKAPQPDMAALLAAFNSIAVPVHRKMYLSLDEASELSGLPRAYLLRKVRSKEIPAVKVPGWRIKRADLENVSL